MTATRSVATREFILRKSTDLFLGKSYEGVSVQDIAREVGITKGSLYHHFEGKEQIFAAVADRVFERFLVDLASLETDSLKDFIIAIVTRQREAIHVELEGSGGPMSPRNFYGILWDAFRIVPAFAERIISQAEQREVTWRRVVARAMRNGEIRADLDPASVAKLFRMVAAGAGISIGWRRTSAQLPDELDSLWNDLYQSLRISGNKHG